eukprot:2937800-Pyramimonas_sp.AAC.1
MFILTFVPRVELAEGVPQAAAVVDDSVVEQREHVVPLREHQRDRRVGAGQELGAHGGLANHAHQPRPLVHRPHVRVEL